jgi:UDP-N-acetylglucosamine acyltransferase
VILSGFSGVHQFCRIGEHAFIGMGCLVNGDVPPFVIMANEYGRPRGVNTEGLKRRGFSPERIAGIRRAYKVLYMSGLQLSEAREELTRIAAESPDVTTMIEFLQQAQRPIVR